jgi:PAS domain S-box-containing protein
MRYRKVVENLHEGLWLVDEDAYTTFVNERMANMLGYTAEEMQGRHFFTFMDERGVAIAKRNLERRRKGIEEDHEFELVTKDGRRVHTIMQASPIFDDQGKYRGALAGVLDITERKQAEAALEEAHAELERRVDERTRDLRNALKEVGRLKNRLEAENIYLQEEIKTSHDFEEIVGESSPLRQALHRVDQVSGTNATVLILGETGTGKELVARAIHNRSPRKERPLVKVNCAALPAPLIESELFGHEKGAFTGAAAQRTGRFEVADGGTIFLDEIGDLPMELQVKLLRVLQEGEFERVGSTSTLTVDVRVIAATNRNLERGVREGTFRSDLYYRLGVFPVTLPPLRERREDIPSLVWHFVKRHQHKMGKTIETVSQSVMSSLQEYEWPGNVRELENVIERAMILSPGSTLIVDEAFTAAVSDPSFRVPQRGLNEVERRHIVEVLDECRWKIKGRGNAAERLGLKPSTLRDRMKKLGITRPGLRGLMR